MSDTVLQPWPKLIDITLENGALPPFPTKLLPRPFSTFVEDIADRMQVPADFAGIPLLVEAAAMLGSEFRVKPKRHDDWSERACLWGMSVAVSGAKKSPPAEEALRPIIKLQSEMFDANKVASDAWEAKPKNDRGPAPMPMRILIHETTVEALGVAMAKNPRGLMLYRDELSGWLRSFDKYRGRGDDRQFFLQANSGGSYSVDRIGRGTIHIKDMCLAIYGTIQPEVAREVFRAGDGDGLNARMQLIACPTLPTAVDVNDKRPDYEARKSVEQHLRKMHASQPEYEDHDGLPVAKKMIFGGEAYAIFNKWLYKNENRPERRSDAAFGAHLSKFPGTFARLALVLHFMKHGEEGPRMEIDEATATAARDFLDLYLEPHAKYLYGILGASPARPGALRIARWLRDVKVKEFSVRDVRRHGWKEFTSEADDRRVIGAAIDLLEALGWVRQIEQSSTARGGRPTTRVLVNPTVLAVSA